MTPHDPKRPSSKRPASDEPEAGLQRSAQRGPGDRGDATEATELDPAIVDDVDEGEARAAPAQQPKGAGLDVDEEHGTSR